MVYGTPGRRLAGAVLKLTPQSQYGIAPPGGSPPAAPF